MPWFEYKPNFIDPTSGEMQTNDLGLRNKKVQLPKPAKVFRIACLGGSTTFEGLDMTMTWPALLEVMIQRGIAPGSDYDSIDVVNCGIEGIGSAGILDRLDFFVSLEPDLVVLYEGINDIVFRYLSSSTYVASKGPLRALGESMELVDRLLPVVSASDTDQISAAVHGITIANFEAAIRSLRAQGISVALCTVPHPDIDAMLKWEQDYLDHNLERFWHVKDAGFEDYLAAINVLNDELEELAKRQSCCLIPLAAYFRGQLGTSEVFADICHMKPAGVFVKARIAATYLLPVVNAMK